MTASLDISFKSSDFQVVINTYLQGLFVKDSFSGKIRPYSCISKPFTKIIGLAEVFSCR